MGEFEQVTSEPAGIGPAGPETVQVWTGRPRKPESVEEWTAQQLSYLGQHRRLPSGAAVIALLEAGEGFDVRAAGKPLTDWERKAVRGELARLLDVARQCYTPAAALMLRMHVAWTRQWGDGERALPPADQIMPRTVGPRAAAMWADPPDAAAVAAAWGLTAG